MGFLNDLAANKTTQETTMPGWYDQAQQNVVNKAAQGASAVPTLGQTVAGGTINQLSNQATNPFTIGQNQLAQIGAGAVNPWITGPGGTVTPNTSTAMGGLFQAQNQQLNQLLPNVTAPVEGSAIASGQFGSLRGQTAVNKAKADAFSQLLTQQMNAALQNQQTGVQAGTGLGTVGSQGVTATTNLGQAQQSDPLLAATGLGKIVAGIQTPTTVTNQTQLAPLSLIPSLVQGVGGSVTGLGKLMDSLGIKEGIGGLWKTLTGGDKPTGGTTGGTTGGGGGSTGGGSTGGGSTGGGSTGEYTGGTPEEIPNTAQPGEEGYGWTYYNDGTSVGPDGTSYYPDGTTIGPDGTYYNENGEVIWSPDQGGGEGGEGGVEEFEPPPEPEYEPEPVYEPEPEYEYTPEPEPEEFDWGFAKGGLVSLNSKR